MTAAEDGKLSVLYRCYDAAGALLYVGVTYRLAARKSQHRKKWPWFADVARIDTHEFYWRRDAEAAELRAIRFEGPRYNVEGVTRPSPLLNRPRSRMVEWEEYIRAQRGEFHRDVSPETVRRWKREGFEGLADFDGDEPLDLDDE